MKSATVDILRAHLMVASFTAMGAELLACLALLVLPASQHAVTSTSFRLLAMAVIVSGVILTRQRAHAAFESAMRSQYATPALKVASTSQPIAVSAHCPRRWLVVLHLRLTGRPFVMAEY